VKTAIQANTLYTFNIGVCRQKITFCTSLYLWHFLVIAMDIICIPEQEIHCLCFVASQSMEPRNGSKTNLEAMEL
jgi:hypothetical protein